MANHKSAIKRNQQNIARRARNVHFKTFMRSRVRRVRDAIASGEVVTAQEALRKAMSALQHVASKGVIHKNTASRKISRLSAAVYKLVSSAGAAS